YQDGVLRFEQAVGHAPLFAPPEPAHHASGVRLDYTRLLLTWTVTGLCTAGVWVGLRLRGQPKDAPPASPWRPVARRLLTWHRLNGLVLVALSGRLIGTLVRLLMQDLHSPGAVQGWLAVEVLVGGGIVGLLLHADWARDRPARRVWQ